MAGACGSRRGRLPLAGVLSVLAALGALRPAGAQLAASNSAFNPMSGQGAPPDPEKWGQYFPVGVGIFLQSLLDVNENSFSFDANVVWTLMWEDERAYDLIMSTPTEGCNYFCSSLPNTVRNADNTSACCDGVYVPQADSINLRGYASQELPYRYVLSALPNGTVRYQSNVQGTWSCSMDYSGYPWDRHYLIIDIYTSFQPIVEGPTLGAGLTAVDGFIVDSQLWDSTPPQLASYYRPASTAFNVPGWTILNVTVTAMSFTEHTSSNPLDFRGGSRTEVGSQTFASPGLRFAIQIQRETRIFYCVIVILPTALIVLFAFGMFSMGRAELKARVMLLATQFLTLIILQFVLSSILPASYSLSGPYYLIIVSYAYTFILFCIAITSHMLLKSPERRTRRHKRQAAKNHFKNWRQTLHARGGLSANGSALRRRRRVRGEDGVVDPAVEPQTTLAMETGDKPPQEPDTETDSDAPDEHHVPVEGFKHEEEGLDAQQDGLPWVPSPNDYEWYRRQEGRFYFKFTPLRRLALWHKFIGMQRSRAYVEYLSHSFESWSRIILLVLFFALTGLIFGVAAARVTSAANAHVFPTKETIERLKAATNDANMRR